MMHILLDPTTSMHKYQSLHNIKAPSIDAGGMRFVVHKGELKGALKITDTPTINQDEFLNVITRFVIKSRTKKLITLAEAQAWFQKRTGTELISNNETHTVCKFLAPETLSFSDGGNFTLFNRFDLQSRVKVIDPELFMKAYWEGIGMYKTYGNGIIITG